LLVKRVVLLHEGSRFAAQCPGLGRVRFLVGLATKTNDLSLKSRHLLLQTILLLTAYLPVCRRVVERSFGLAELCETLQTEILTPEVMKEYLLQLRTNLLLDASTLDKTVRLRAPQSREPEGLASR
jgi:hypothetical protein